MTSGFFRADIIFKNLLLNYVLEKLFLSLDFGSIIKMHYTQSVILCLVLKPMKTESIALKQRLL